MDTSDGDDRPRGDADSDKTTFDLLGDGLGWDEAAELALVRLDKALDATTSATSRTEALAALTRATSELNSFFADPGIATPIGLSSPPHLQGTSFAIVGDSGFRAMAFLPWKKDRSPDLGQKWDDRVNKYWQAVEHLVQTYHPDQFQISVGFPQIVSVTLTWNVPRAP